MRQPQQQIAAPQAAVQLRPQPGQVLPPALLQPRQQPQLLETETPAEKMKREFTKVGTTVLFDFDSSQLSDYAQKVLDRQAAFLKAQPEARIILGGHADERGTREYNLALGERRAAAARDYLVAKGVNSARIRIISYGKERPTAVGSNEAAWRLNRRAESVLN